MGHNLDYTGQFLVSMKIMNCPMKNLALLLTSVDITYSFFPARPFLMPFQVFSSV
jgi:hypothetical protein